MTSITITICYLDGPTPTLLETVLPPNVASCSVGWGDRVARGERPAIFGALVDGRRWESASSGIVRIDGYYDVASDLVGCLAVLHDAVSAAWHRDITSRPEVAAAVEGYRATVLDALDREYASHAARWAQDCEAIARAFRRRRVCIGEQTVPGKCVVRSTRGRMLGYAHVWDGRWIGTVERV